MLRAVGAGAGAGLFAAGSVGTVVASDDADGSVGPSDCDCHLEFRCDTDLLCKSPSTDTPYYQEYRECCVCDNGETACDDWEYNGCCSG